MDNHTFRLNHQVTVLDDVIFALIEHSILDSSPQVKQVKPVGSDFIHYLSKNGKRGISVSQSPKGLEIAVRISLNHQADISACMKLQKKIMRDIQDMLGLCVSSVKIRLEKIHFD